MSNIRFFDYITHCYYSSTSIKQREVSNLESSEESLGLDLVRLAGQLLGHLKRRGVIVDSLHILHITLILPARLPVDVLEKDFVCLVGWLVS